MLCACLKSEFGTKLGQHEIAVEPLYSMYIIIFKTVLFTLNVGFFQTH